MLLSADVAVADPTSMPPGAPEVSFIVSHRGLERLPLLLQTLRSIAGQEGVPVECIVVEQDVEPFVQERLPEWVRYVFDRTDGPDVPYNRSRALNRGAAAAGGVLLVLHDSDIVIPAAYAAEVRRVLGEGYDIANLKRFIFCLARSRDMDGYMEADLTKGEGSVEAVVQNLCGGASLAVRRETFAALGGMDEGFEGWGGEDVEFWDRCQTRRVWNWSYLPMLHLWHPPQPGKTPSKDTPAMRRLESVLQIPGQERIRALRVSAAGRSFEPRLPEAQAVHGEVS